MQLVFPAPTRAVTVEEAYAAPLRPDARRDDTEQGREAPGAPWVGLCMVAAIDGSTVVDARSAALSSDNDSAVLHHLRSIADVILVGAATVRTEGYGPPKRPGQRIGVVTASGNVDTDAELFRCGAGFVVTTLGCRLGDVEPGDEGVDVVRAGTDEVDFAVALEAIAERFGPGGRGAGMFVQSEGGARLNAAMFEADVIDEINLTTSPLVVGGGGPRLTREAPDLAHRFELVQLVIDEASFTYARWRRSR